MAKIVPPFIAHEPIVIIIEGPDLAGKSTLVDKLSKEYPGIVIKVSQRPMTKSKGEMILFKKHLYSVLDYVNHNRQTKTIVFDRFYPTEMVYSKVMRGYDSYDDGDFRDMERVIRARNHLYIYCRPAIEILHERFHSRGDEHINIENFDELIARYDRFFSETKMNKIQLDTVQPVEDLIEQIKKITK